MTHDIEVLDTQGNHCEADVTPCFLPLVVLFSVAPTRIERVVARFDRLVSMACARGASWAAFCTV